MRFIELVAAGGDGYRETRERVADDMAGRARARAHIGARRLVWRDYDDGDRIIGIALPPGTGDPEEAKEWCFLGEPGRR